MNKKTKNIIIGTSVGVPSAIAIITTGAVVGKKNSNKNLNSSENGLNQFQELLKNTNNLLEHIIDKEFKQEFSVLIKDKNIQNFSKENFELLSELNKKIKVQFEKEDQEIKGIISNLNSEVIKNELLAKLKQAQNASEREEVILLAKKTFDLDEVLNFAIKEINNLKFLSAVQKNGEIEKLRNGQIKNSNEIDKIVNEAKNKDTILELKNLIDEIEFPSKNKSLAYSKLNDSIYAIDPTFEDSKNNLFNLKEKILGIKKEVAKIKEKLKSLDQPNEYLNNMFDNSIEKDEFERLNNEIDLVLIKQNIQKNKNELNDLVQNLPYPDLRGNPKTDYNSVQAILDIKQLYAHDDPQAIIDVKNDLNRIRNEIRFALERIKNISEKNKFTFIHNNRSINLYEELRKTNTVSEFELLNQLISEAQDQDKKDAILEVNKLSYLKNSTKNEIIKNIGNAKNINEINVLFEKAQKDDQKDELLSLITFDDYINSSSFKNQELANLTQKSLDTIYANINENYESNNYLNYKQKITDLKNKINKSRDLINNTANNLLLDGNATKKELFKFLVKKTDGNIFEEVKIEIEKQKLKKKAFDLPYPLKNNSQKTIGIDDLFLRIDNLLNLKEVNVMNDFINDLSLKITGLLQEIEDIGSSDKESQKNRLKEKLSRADTTEELEDLKQEIQRLKSQTAVEYENNQKNKLRNKASTLNYPNGVNAIAISKLNRIIDNLLINEIESWSQKIDLIQREIEKYKQLINTTAPKNHSMLLNLLDEAVTNEDFDNLNNKINETLNNDKNEAIKTINELSFLPLNTQNNISKEAFINQLNALNPITYSDILNIIQKASLENKKQNLINKVKELNYPSKSEASAISELINQINNIANFNETDTFLVKIEEIINNINIAQQKYNQVQNKTNDIRNKFDNAITQEDFNELNLLLEKAIKNETLELKKQRIDALVEDLDYPKVDGSDFQNETNDAPAIEEIKNLYSNKDESLMNQVEASLGTINNEIIEAKRLISKISTKNKTNFQSSNSSNTLNLILVLRSTNTSEEFRDLFALINEAIAKDKEEAKKAIDLLVDLKQNKKNDFKTQINNSQNYNEIVRILESANLEDKYDSLRKIIQKQSYNSNLQENSELDIRIKNSLKRINDQIVNTTSDQIESKRNYLIQLNDKINELRILIENLNQNTILEENHTKARLYNLLASKYDLNGLKELELEIDKEKLKKIITQLPYPSGSQASAISDWNIRINNAANNEAINQLKNEANEMIEQINSLKNEINNINVNNANNESLNHEELESRKNNLRQQLDRVDTIQEINQLKEYIKQAQTQTTNEYTQNERIRLKRRVDNLPYPSSSNALAINEIKDLIDAESIENLNAWNQTISDINQKIIEAKLQINKLSSPKQSSLLNQLNLVNTDQEFETLNMQIISAKNEDINEITQLINNLNNLSNINKNNFISQLNNSTYEQMQNILLNAKKADLEAKINSLPYPRANAVAKNELLNEARPLSTIEDIDRKLNEINNLNNSILSAITKINNLPFPEGTRAVGNSDFKNLLNTFSSISEIENMIDEGFADRIRNYTRILSTNLNPFPEDSRNNGLKNRINSLNTRLEENELMWNLYETKRQRVLVPLIDGLRNLSTQEKTNLKNRVITIPSSAKTNDFANFNEQMQRLDDVILEAQKQDGINQVDLIQYPSNNNSDITKARLKNNVRNSSNLSEINNLNNVHLALRNKVNEINSLIVNINIIERVNDINNELGSVDNISNFTIVELKIKRAQTIQALSLLEYLQQNQLTEYINRIDNVPTQTEILSIQNEANLQNEKERIKRIADNLGYHNPNSTSAINAKQRLKNEIQLISNQSDLSQKETEINEFSNALISKIQEVSQLPYNSSNAEARSQILESLNQASNIQDLNNALPPTWINELNIYKQAIIQHFGRSSNLMFRLDKTIPVNDGDFGLNNLKNNIYLTKKNTIINAINHLSNLNSNSRQPFINQINNLTQNFPQNINVLDEMNNILLEARKQNYYTFIDNLSYPAEVDFNNDVIATKNEIKQQLITTINHSTNFVDLEARLNQINIKLSEAKTKINQLVNDNQKTIYKRKLAQTNHIEFDELINELNQILAIKAKIQEMTNITNARNQADKINQTNPSIERLRNSLLNKLSEINASQINDFSAIVNRKKDILDDLKRKFAAGDVLVIKGFVEELINAQDLSSINVIANKIQPFYNELREWWKPTGMGTSLRINQSHIIVHRPKYKPYNELLNDVWTSTDPNFLVDLNRNKKQMYEGVINFSKINKNNLPLNAVSHYQNAILEANTRTQIDSLINEFNNYKNTIFSAKQELEVTGATSNRSEFNDLINNAQTLEQITNIKNNILLFKNSLQQVSEVINRYQSIENHKESKVREFESQKANVLNKIQADELIARINESSRLQEDENNFNRERNEFIENNINSSLNLDLNAKETINLYLRTIDNYQEYTNNKNKIQDLILAVNNLVEKKRQANDYFKQSLINDERLYDYHKKLVEVNKLVNNNELLDVDFTNISTTINKVNNFINEIDSMLRRRDNFMPGLSFEDMMRNEATRLFGFEINQEANKFELGNFTTSGSFNLDNAKIYFDHYDNNNFDFEIVDLRLQGNSLETLNATIKVTFKNESKRSININKEISFSNGVKNNLDSISINDLDQIYTINYDEIKTNSISEWNSLNLEDVKNNFQKNSKGIGNYFKYEIKNKPTYINSRLNAQVSILFNNQELKTININSRQTFNFRETSVNKNSYIDQINLQKVNQLVNSTNPKERFFAALEIKDINNPDVHTNFLASQAVEKFNTLYKLPKYGRYEVFVKEAYDVNDLLGKANFILWYKIDGNEAPGYNSQNQKRYNFKADGFLLQNFYDIRSKSKHFAENDFKSAEFRMPDENTKKQIESINESNFAWRYAIGKFWGWHNGTNSNYRTLNPVKFMQQEAFLNFEYMIRLTNGIDNKGDDLVNQEILQFNQSALHNKNITKNTTNIDPIKNNYFRYFYDFRLENKRSLSFRIGFINKSNQNIRYTSTKRYTLINLVNDYEQALYPEIILNNIKISDLNINSNEISRHTISQYATNINMLNNHIRVRGDSNNKITYNHFEMNASSFRIIDIKRINATEAYIRFDTARFNGGPNQSRFKGDVWYKISGFRSDNNNNEQTLSFESRNLTTIYDSQQVIKRTRIIEPLWSDLMWSLNKNNNIASWTLQKKYIEKTLLQPNTTNREINVKLLGNILFNDNDKNSRIRNQGFDFKINLDDLISKKIIKYEFTTANLENNQFKYFVIVEWNDTGITFKITTQDQSYKLILDEPEVQGFSNNQKFDKNRAFVLLPAAAKIEIAYTNNKEHEDFNIWSNRFDYNDIEYTEFQQPILFSNDINFLKDKSVYYPNQNVGYKLHEGFKMNIEQMRIKKQLEWDVVRAPFSRSMVVDQGRAFGTLSIMGKVSDDPNDFRFYAMTNNHVETVNNFADISGNNFLLQRNKRKYVFAPKASIFQETPWNGRQWDKNDILRTWNIRDTKIAKIENVPIKIIWSGSNQISKNGSVNNNSVDLTVFIIDFKNDYLRSKREGWMDIVWKVENLMKIKGTKLEIDYKNSVISVPHIREAGNISWPSVRYAGQVIRRFEKDRLSTQNHSFFDHSLVKWQQQHHYVQYFGGGGSSGSGLFLGNDVYMATWNAGSTGSYDGYFSQAPKYATRDYNYMGVNFENENPLELKNTRSLGAQILRANLRNPNEFDLPWFLKPIKEN